ncbi:MAG: DUF2064 domain-containing protein [Nocardioidaceae bacterium]|nr:DUF2064 domain-containing protein [Nocardioidaceae bacterium]
MSAPHNQKHEFRPPACLVVAKAPVPGQVKTRLGARIGLHRSAELAAAALLDTFEVCTATFGPSRCHLALAGDLSEAVGAAEFDQALSGWQVRPQRGEGLAHRLAHAHADVSGPVLQIGMDTPQLTPALLQEVVDGLVDHDAVLGPADDGGWWVLAVREASYAAVVAGVPMSSPQTYQATRAALLEAGLSVGVCTMLRDVDEATDADIVAEQAPSTRFARTWAQGEPQVVAR